MSKIETGGPAFPVSIPGWGDNGASGMTLRDYFAIHASREELTRFRVDKNGNGLSEVEARYAYADAMIRARGGDRD
ncbi:hypothetical protein BG46_15870 [Brucella anthropi]|uniref:hypothetical protein n=1 Tax=Brucella anthropi TaxID=529 RepID=UPI0004473C44|nr:hypothetical protein [Brucella anthropi]EXL06240.1 hypothetical protein BG46_15870 [Brucella anthropi]